MKYFLASVFTICVLSINVHGQTTQDSVKAVINKMFTAMFEADGKMFAECFTDSAILQTIDTKNSVAVKTDLLSKFARIVGGLKKNTADERISFDAIHIDADLASAWTPYNFYYNGKFSHCGVNSFQLVRLNGTWKINYLIDTRRTNTCP
jgi:hypothetical protein